MEGAAPLRQQGGGEQRQEQAGRLPLRQVQPGFKEERVRAPQQVLPGVLEPAAGQNFER